MLCVNWWTAVVVHAWCTMRLAGSLDRFRLTLDSDARSSLTPPVITLISTGFLTAIPKLIRTRLHWNSLKSRSRLSLL
ncbi:hypothetical protein BJV77DRAFT_1025854 [Russula vinacea]|nr:hypothetical protein BJV77DRAFT_1025854 [Russula vinacea]